MTTKEILEKAEKKEFTEMLIQQMMQEIQQDWENNTTPPNIETLIQNTLSKFDNLLLPTKEELLKSWNDFVNSINQKLENKSTLISQILHKGQPEIKKFENILKSETAKIQSEIEMKELELELAQEDYQEFMNCQFVHKLKNN
jgi:hypothetical protein